LKRLKIMVAMLALVLFAAGPATADATFANVGSVDAFSESVFLGDDFGDAEVGGAVDAEGLSEFLFF
jgi:hypothetical protein